MTSTSPTPVRSGLAWLAVAALALTGCLPVTRPSVKIGLVAPFEGRYRSVGYEVIYAVRLAVREANAAGGVAGYSVELVALDDAGDPAQAVEQAHKLATDPQVVGALGHWLEATTLAAAPAYAAADIPLLATAAAPTLDAQAFRLWPAGPCALPTGEGCVAALEDLKRFPEAPVTVSAPAPLPADSSDPAFAGRYTALATGVTPGVYAVLAYDGANTLLAAIAAEIAAHGSPTRRGVADQLAVVEWPGLSGPVAFTPDHAWAAARTWPYVWQAGGLTPP